MARKPPHPPGSSKLPSFQMNTLHRRATTTTWSSKVEQELRPLPITTRTRELNDAFRRTFVGGALVITPGIEALAPATRSELLREVRTYNQFDADNDPHNEHDFGSLEINGQRVFWKIDYYDRDVQFGSKILLIPRKTRASSP